MALKGAEKGEDVAILPFFVDGEKFDTTRVFSKTGYIRCDQPPMQGLEAKNGSGMKRWAKYQQYLPTKSECPRQALEMYKRRSAADL
jgi:hypothetical protein